MFIGWLLALVVLMPVSWLFAEHGQHGNYTSGTAQNLMAFAFCTTVVATVLGRLLHWLIDSPHGALVVMTILEGLFVVFLDTLVVSFGGGTSGSEGYAMCLVLLVFVGMTAATIYGQQFAWQKL